MERAAPAGVVRPYTSCWPLLGPREKGPKLERSHRVIPETVIPHTTCSCHPSCGHAGGPQNRGRPCAVLTTTVALALPATGAGGETAPGSTAVSTVLPRIPLGSCAQGAIRHFPPDKTTLQKQQPSGSLGPVSVNTVAEPEWTRASSRDQEGPSSCRGEGALFLFGPQACSGLWVELQRLGAKGFRVGQARAVAGRSPHLPRDEGQPQRPTMCSLIPGLAFVPPFPHGQPC